MMRMPDVSFKSICAGDQVPSSGTAVGTQSVRPRCVQALGRSPGHGATRVMGTSSTLGTVHPPCQENSLFFRPETEGVLGNTAHPPSKPAKKDMGQGSSHAASTPLDRGSNLFLS